ncbi:hypothetical protein [Caldanaerobacter subterraneus]|uniref:Uncharacterized protein n=1 Tax=Caldanaerobacter subterraneus TaxID=911092 RepID=A0A4R2JL26_9THEO|nr:hypothetical protein [Caldanaerobacter subterraneus]TCO57776.1 hypothetical protein EV203_1285 [Caldanaerobacter subterraneus]
MKRIIALLIIAMLLVSAVEVFASNGYTLRNANITIEKGYLVLRGNVNFYYKKPTLLNSLTPAEEISIPLEGKTVLKKLK